MDKLKKIIVKYKNNKLIYFLTILNRYNRSKKSLLKTFFYSFKCFQNFYMPNKDIKKSDQFKLIAKKTKFSIVSNKFKYNIDIFKTLNIDNNAITNISIDYETVLSKSLYDLQKEIKTIKNEEYYTELLCSIEGLDILLNREISCLKKQKSDQKYINYLENIKTKKCVGFEEALQRILFFNQVLWQTGHSLMGLGRLDLILAPYYRNDLKNKVLTKSDAKKLLKEFIETLHDYYWWKSNVLLGDTGQIIILGGLKEDGVYFCNDLTYMFLDAVSEIKKPEPKLLLRVSSNMPKELLESSLKVVKTGIGSPLFSNDDIIIKKMIAFGYEKNDAYNYSVSACWEPLVPGYSMDQNNINSLVYMIPFNEMFQQENLEKIDSIDTLLKKYNKYLKKYIHDIVNRTNKIVFDKDPILSLFIGNCIKNEKDISAGGAKYSHYGFTSVSLSNVVNSIMNIDKYVFKNKKMTLKEFYRIVNTNYTDEEKILLECKNNKIRYGVDDKEILNISNRIIRFVEKELTQYDNKLGGKYKFGLSSPAYISDSKNIMASFDGRKNGDPFGVHISNDMGGSAYTELINFASKLDYNSININGNVIDFMISPDLIEKNFDKFVLFMEASIKIGFYQMQMNVISSEMLIKAKNNPELFPNLIVRVWGFSSYFNDLPEEYKNLLIERALRNESKSY